MADPHGHQPVVVGRSRQVEHTLDLDAAEFVGFTGLVAHRVEADPGQGDECLLIGGEQFNDRYFRPPVVYLRQAADALRQRDRGWAAQYIYNAWQAYAHPSALAA
ncbi:hypothetical protein [Corynebacterium variabile]